MGCFTCIIGKKKKSESIVHPKHVLPDLPQESIPTVLPEPQKQSFSLQSAPPSFRDKVRTVQIINRLASNRTRALSAPSSINLLDQDTVLSNECEEQDSKVHGGLIKDHLGPQPLPLPAPQTGIMLKTVGSFKSGNAIAPLLVTPGPLPLPRLVGVRNFSYDEIATACHQFSPDRCMSECLSSVIYKASFGDDFSGSKKLEATVTRLLPSSQGFKEFLNEVNIIASLQHPQLCKLLGYHAREGSERQMLVYERLFHGSLDTLLYGRSDGPPIGWNSRMKVALCAAQGLAFLHEEGPFQAMYNEFSTANIQIDKDFSAKLSGYGCVSPNPEILDTSVAVANLSVETLERGLLTPKSNVWSFGIVLLELLTGRKNLDNRYQGEERDLVRWSRPFLADDSRLALIMDPRLKGRFPPKASRIVADIALRCLQKDSLERPTMRTIVESLQNIQDMKHSCRFPLQEPTAIAGKNMSRSPSLNGVMTKGAPRLSFPPSPPLRHGSSISFLRQPSMPMLRPRQSCSSIVSLQDINGNQEIRKSRSTTARRIAGVEGF